MYQIYNLNICTKKTIKYYQKLQSCIKWFNYRIRIVSDTTDITNWYLMKFSRFFSLPEVPLDNISDRKMEAGRNFPPNDSTRKGAHHCKRNNFLRGTKF